MTMWSPLPTKARAVGCRQPYSFFFDFVGRYWKSDSNRIPIHRICTLARKQGATFFVLEDAIDRPAVRTELNALDIARGGNGTAEALCFSFFSSPDWPDVVGETDISRVDIAKIDRRHFLGQAVIINYRQAGAAGFGLSYLFEAIFPVPSLRTKRGVRRKLLNNFIYTEEKFVCKVLGRQFSTAGLYYCQQNSLTHVCAHASLRMALTSAANAKVTPDYVNMLLGVVPPCGGLALGDLVRIIEDQGKRAEVITCQKLDRKTGKYLPVLPREIYISVLASIVESGNKALLTFSTAEDNGAGASAGPDHVVLVFGHTRHSDEWHPQAIPAYAGPASALYYPASSWIDHFLIHDDNFGPYYTLSSSALEFKKEVSAHTIIAIRDNPIGTASQFAEANTASQLANLLPTLSKLGSGRWFDYLTAKQRKYVLRTILVTKEEYLTHLRTARGHDGSRMSSSEVRPFKNLPDRFWMVEFSLPPLFTGNHSKLGEAIVSVDKVAESPDDASILALRLPALALLAEGAGPLMPHTCSLNSHIGIFQLKAHPEVW
ncbi:MAG: hypothetical protein ACJ8ER_04440 [Allosphingosinicella sp.]